MGRDEIDVWRAFGSMALILGAILILITLIFWSGTVFMAIWTGDGIPAAWQWHCNRGVPPWLWWMC